MTYFIAEIGVNHNGSIHLAKKLILAAKKSGANAVKFQSFVSDEVVVKTLKLAPYQGKNLKKKSTRMVDMIKKYELSYNQQKLLYNFCKVRKIDFLSSPFDLDSAKFLVENLKLKTIKIPSGEITNFLLLEYLSNFKINIILSTGMSTINEITQSINLLKSKNKISNQNITLLHCNTSYPTNIFDVNLKAMLTLKKIFKVKIGYSDHTNSKLVGLIAVSLGASIVEKHITLNKSFVGPDHKASFLPSEFKELVNLAKDAKIILGNEDKFISNSEKVNIYYARKSLVAKKNILKGQRFNLDNITAKRPFGGISPMKIKKIIGKRSRYFFRKDDLIKL